MNTVTEMEAEAGRDRRRTPRQRFVTKALLYRDDRSASPQRVTLRDISMLGIGFESARPVEPGTRCRIKVEAGPVNTTLKVRVVCCGQIDNEHYRLGGELIGNEIERPETDEATTPTDEHESGPYLVLPEPTLAIEPEDRSPPEDQPAPVEQPAEQPVYAEPPAEQSAVEEHAAEQSAPVEHPAEQITKAVKTPPASRSWDRGVKL